ncbi:Spc98 family protein [Dothidotthia symphoricarpi CBS 119687]|uniref:Spindle pole body component n=1 Tax=Dothidotthia symphoricarpi CBS 119687 TaxID=1392245 RepID=A0A6A6AE65_9PLEO|nr:Spc98 family protein [Dothidotthia symphoricarpi CBS 119687]KAF2129583.1 Spc98 family protein [Dothidotthia symphoricarpi CBS 119687]
MLHEILLSLSGHPSALFDANPSLHVTSTATRLLSPPEAELLSSIGHLSRLHRKTRDHVAKIASSHSSTVCRAVATAITSHHLDRFQRKIIEVESRILKQDASIVGAYSIVPLAGIVNEFSEWVKLMEWLWNISNFILPSEAQSKSDIQDRKTASGAEIIDKLRTEVQTGYPDIEAAARQLGKVAEASWLRQLSTWLLYGRLPSFGASDFFVKQEDDESDELSFVVQNKFLPKFVTRQTASSILFVGKSLNQIRCLPSTSKVMSTSTTVSELELLPVHVEQLSQVVTPVSAAKLSEAVANIRLSLSRNLLQHLLPREKIVETLTILHQFFLIGRGEFAMTLIAEADEKILSRHRGLLTKPNQSVKGFLLKDTEINQILARAFSVLSTLGGEDDHTDDILDTATEILHLTTHNLSGHRPGTPGRAKDADSALPQLVNFAFDELLLSVPMSLTMDIRSPLDLFVTKADLDVYSSINAYLLAVRRAHLHLAQLWRQSSIRREHPGPPGYQYSNTAYGKTVLRRRRQRTNERTRQMRRIWATCSAAIFFLAEGEAYFQGEVVQESFKHFLSWVSGPRRSLVEGSRIASPTFPTTPGFRKSSTEGDIEQQHDPEVLALAHRQFLSSVAYSLLLTDMNFTKTLRTFCTHVDELVAYITRLNVIQQNLDLEEDEGIEDYAKNYKQDEKEMSLEMDRARRRLDSDLKALVERLREIDSERIGASAPGFKSGVTMQEGMFEPLRVGGIDRLLMKLDWGGEDEEEEQHEDLL